MAKAKQATSVKPAAQAKDKKVDTSTGKPGTTTDLSSSVITVVAGAKNPASRRSDRFRRFALMANGMTGGEWYAACRNNDEITGRAHSKLLLRAVRMGFITLKEPTATK